MVVEYQHEFYYCSSIISHHTDRVMPTSQTPPDHPWRGWKISIKLWGNFISSDDVINDKARALIVGFSSPICLNECWIKTRPHGKGGHLIDMTKHDHGYSWIFSNLLSHNLTCLLWWYYIYIMAQWLSPAKFHHLPNDHNTLITIT